MTSNEIDAKSFGASVSTYPDSTSCQVCSFSIGEEGLSCDVYKSIGHSYCFNTLSLLRGESHKHAFCMELQCTSTFQQRKPNLLKIEHKDSGGQNAYQHGFKSSSIEYRRQRKSTYSRNR
ncbi:hypothetical protein LOD99_7390 [Oopsacas minuta]|uniref:Uncharacterized protein n=1 Tax=Oopsacas minuta TaxID=111878 RepID=A0AAV7JWD9_9METZ|nr:hypothetical protein LOD99_7390 [Oopsacas minuta]